jgi:hypothetical protein
MSNDVRVARGLTRVLDELVRIPGTNIRLGLDSIIGLIPGVGDLAGAAMSGYLILAAGRLGAPKAVLLRMLGNIAFDSMIGVVPLLGDLFDVAFKANTRNLKLLERYAEQPERVKATSRWFVIGVLVALAVVTIAAVALAIEIVRRLLPAAF